ncbi:PH domain-containing protein [Lysinibacillus sp. KU-BSD001]|uniref:PH domain-containing protein n=1 Tax=Lysinibacillus sp. KU-BSD001 TaxID=3141328 RepID=UPI0036EAFD11
MSKLKLHAVSALINCVKALKDMAIPIIIIFVANGFNFTLNFRDERFFSQMIPLFILVAALIFTFVSGILKWWTFRYWFEDSELRVEYGLFVKKKRYIPFDRIQSLNYKEGIFHRIFGLVQVLVETAGSKDGKPEAQLTAITRAAADQIEQEMNKAKMRGRVETEVTAGVIQPQGRVIHKMSPKDLIILATTSSGIGVVIFGVFAVISQFAEYIPFEWIYDEFSHLVKYSIALIIGLIFIGVLGAWIISVALTLLNYFDFTVTEENDRLIITRGLLEKKRITIPLNRVQAIKIIENPLRQPFGLATVQVESAGGGFAEGQDKKIVLFPLISKKEAMGPLAALFPQFQFQLEEQQMIRSPRRARPFFYRIDFLWLIPLMIVPSYVFYPYGLLSLLLVIPVILLGIWQHKTARFQVYGSQLMIIYRQISRVTFCVEKSRIQVTEQRQSYFQKRKQVATGQVVVMSGMAGAKANAYHMEQRDIEALMNWYEYKKTSEE